MYYIDTSIIVAYYYPEPLSEKVDAFLSTQVRPSISALTELEFFSAISKKVREGALDIKDATRIKAKFLSHIDNKS
jgi:hypothetical protein